MATGGRVPPVEICCSKISRKTSFNEFELSKGTTGELQINDLQQDACLRSPFITSRFLQIYNMMESAHISASFIAFEIEQLSTIFHLAARSNFDAHCVYDRGISGDASSFPNHKPYKNYMERRITLGGFISLFGDHEIFMVDQCSAVLMPRLDRTIFVLSFVSLLFCAGARSLKQLASRRSTAKEIGCGMLPYADMCEYIHWFVSHLWRKKLLGELGAIWRIDVFINTKHQGIKKHDIPDSWTNAELKHLGSSQLSNWNALTKNN